MTGATFGMLVAFGVLFPHQRILLYFVAEVTMRTAVWVFVGIEVILMVGSMLGGGGAWISVVVQFGGALGGYLMILYWRGVRRRSSARSRRRYPAVHQPRSSCAQSQDPPLIGPVCDALRPAGAAWRVEQPACRTAARTGGSFDPPWPPPSTRL